MELWGFTQSNLKNSKPALLQMHGAHNRGGAGTTNNDLPPPQNAQPIPENTPATPENLARLTDPRQPRRVVLEYTVRRNGHDVTERVETHFTHREGTGEDVDAKEEAADIFTNLEQNEAYRRYTAAGYSNPMVRYFRANAPGSTNLRVGRTDLMTLQHIADAGRTTDEIRRGVTAGTPDTNDGFSSSPMTLAQARAKIREMKRRNDQDINEVLSALANGDWEAVKRGVRRLAKAGRLSVMDTMAIYTDMRRRLEEKNSHLREDLAHLGTSPAPERRAAIERAMRDNNLTLEGIPEQLRDATEDARNAAENAERTISSIERIDSAGNR